MKRGGEKIKGSGNGDVPEKHGQMVRDARVFSRLIYAPCIEGSGKVSISVISQNVMDR